MMNVTPIQKYHYVLRRLREIEAKIYYWDIEDQHVLLYRTFEDYARLNCYIYSIEQCYELMKRKERKDKIKSFLHEQD